jgi:hypothetical protein
MCSTPIFALLERGYRVKECRLEKIVEFDNGSSD